MTYEQEAEQMIGYFQRCLAEAPEDKVSWRESYQSGLDAIVEWLRLIRSAQASQDKVSALLEEVRRHRSEGSGWYDLACRVYAWARDCGYSVPPHEVWLSSEDVPEPHDDQR